MINEKDTPAFRISFFAALCLFLSAVEYAIPKPIPFLRLGLANLPILLSLKKMRIREIFLLVLLKILGQAFISGTLFSYIFVFSFAGTFTSFLVMLVVFYLFDENKGFVGKKGYRFFTISNIGISVAGALGNNLAQILCAQLIVFGTNVKYIAPVLLISGLCTGLILGIFCSLFESKSEWYKLILMGTEYPQDIHNMYSNNSSNTCGKPVETVDKAVQKEQKRVETKNLLWFIICLIIMIPFVMIKNVIILWIFVLVIFLLTLIRRHGKVKIIPSIFITLSVVFFALFSPYGKILFTIGSWRITLGAISTGLHRSGILVGMVFLSQCAVNKNIKIPGKIGTFIASVFTYLDLLTEKRISFKPGKIIESIDERLIELWNV